MPGLAGGSTLAWQCPDAVSHVEPSAAIMRGYPEPMHKMLGVLIKGRDLNNPDPPFGATHEHSTISNRSAQIRSLCAPASTESADERALSSGLFR